MARGNVVLTPAAKKDMREIWRYISTKNSDFVADLVITRLRAAMDVLSSAPLIGRIRKEFRGNPRSLSVRPHTIFYQPLPERAGIEVLRVLHGARDLSKILR